MSDSKLEFRLSFSGGGFRATFYCLGAFRRLVELGLADKVVSISSVSGGSITAGAIMNGLSQRPFADINDFDKKVTEPLRKLGQVRLRELITWPVYIIWFVFTFFYFQRIAPFVDSVLTLLCPFKISSWFILINLSVYSLIVYFFSQTYSTFQQIVFILAFLIF